MLAPQSFGMSINVRNQVCNIAADGLAWVAGVRLGDVVCSFNGIEIASEDSLFAAMLAVPNGSSASFKVQRTALITSHARMFKFSRGPDVFSFEYE